MTMNSGIYQINLGNGWFYIGSSSHLSRRKHEHENDLKRGDHINRIMQRNWNKYKFFDFTILQECSISELLGKEQFFLDIHFSNPKNANIAPTAGSTFGMTLSSETRAKISTAQKGQVRSAETRAKISAAHKGRVFSAETRAKISAAKKGKKGFTPSIETRSKISASQKGQIRSPESRQKMVDAWVIRRQRSV